MSNSNPRTEAANWRPISTAPEAQPILVNAPAAHRGLDSCEVVVACRIDGELTFWTNGGPNGGTDLCFEDGEPTHWMPLPEKPL